MKARPILFSGPMIRALLEGRKTQTRRVVKDHTFYACLTGDCPHDTQRECDQAMATECRYGQPGDLLWVRETASVKHASETCVSCDNADIAGLGAIHTCRSLAYRADGDPGYIYWTPGIHMPRWASRLTLRITDVRVQRLKDIDGLDAIAEGITRVEGEAPWRTYLRLWNEINGEGAWQRDPWVWALTFEVIKANVDSVLRSAA